MYNQLFNDLNDVINVYGNDRFCEPVIYRLKGVIRQAEELYLAQVEPSTAEKQLVK